jgi:hypothetical protein
MCISGKFEHPVKSSVVRSGLLSVCQIASAGRDEMFENDVIVGSLVAITDTVAMLAVARKVG